MSTISEGIARELIKVRLKICCWNGKTALRDLAREIAQQKDAVLDAVGASIKYIPARYAAPITTAASQLRTYWNNNTLPWDNDAWRVVPVAQYQLLTDTTITHKRTFDSAVSDMLANYMDVLELSKKDLGTLFNADKFPSEDQIKDKYGIFLYSDVIPLASDVRITGLEQGLVDSIKENITRQYEERVSAGVSDILNRIKEIADDVVARVNKPAEGVKFGTLLKKIDKTCDCIGNLNLTNDPTITDLISKLKDLRTKHSSEVLKVNDTARRDILSDATAILGVLDNYSG